MAAAEAAVLMMGYGSPDSTENIAEYLERVKSGHGGPGHQSKPSKGEIDKLASRYAGIGGSSPFNKITAEQARSLQAVLDIRGLDIKVYVGMRHWEPSINAAVRKISGDGITKIIGLPMAPFHSKMSTGLYQRCVTEAIGSDPGMSLSFAKDWHTNELFMRSWAKNISVELNKTESARDTRVLFTAHSLPSAALGPDDLYEKHFNEASSGIAELVGTKEWSVAYQSGGSRQGWLGPDVKLKLAELEKDNGRNVIIAPIGFVADNLETLYDLDIECVKDLNGKGMYLRRISAPNASPDFINALADSVT
jgi:ferrochelatase